MELKLYIWFALSPKRKDQKFIKKTPDTFSWGHSMAINDCEIQPKFTNRSSLVGLTSFSLLALALKLIDK